MRRTALVAVLLAFVVVVMGAWVRLSNAGLGCPDWPGCYGHVTPLGARADIAAGTTNPAGTPLAMERAWKEMLHRYAAGALVILILGLTALAFTQRRVRVRGAGMLCLALVGIVLIQALLGMLTVTWLVAPQIVTLHLLFGLITLGLLWWLWLALNQQAPRAARTSLGLGHKPSMGWEKTFGPARRLAQLALAALLIQVALGGWTSTNYAAIACPDFPTCQNAWWPDMEFGAGFHLWDPLTVNYEGGRLDNAARVAIHFTHRLGAFVAAVAMLLSALWVLRERGLSRARWEALAVIGALVLQLFIGITMVEEGFPLWLATAHNGGAALTLLAVLALNFRLGAIAARA